MTNAISLARTLSAAVLAWRSHSGLVRHLRWGLLVLACLNIAMTAWTSTRKSVPDKESISTAHAMLTAAPGARPIAENFSKPLGYPALLAVLAKTTPGTDAGLACWGQRHDGCTTWTLPVVVYVQILAAVGSVVLIHRLALLLSGRAAIALVTVVLTFFSFRLGEFAGMLRPEIWYLLFSLLYVSALLPAGERRSWGYAAASGAALAIAGLFQPLTLLLAPLTFVQLLLGRDRSVAGPIGDGRGAAATFLATTIAVTGVAYWLATANGYDGAAPPRHIAINLAERTAFVGIDRSTLMASVLTSIPWFGDALSSVLPVGEARLIGIASVPGSLVRLGSDTIFPDAFARAGQAPLDAIALLLRERIAGQPIGYLASLPSVLARGLFAGGGIIALLGVFHLASTVRFAHAQNRLRDHMLVLAPIAALFVLNTLCTANGFWLNPLLPFVYAYAIAYVSGGW